MSSQWIRVKPLFGWAGRAAAKQAYDQIGHTFPRFFIAAQTRPTDNRRLVLWDFSKKVTGGSHLPTYKQEIGDCVSMGAANAVNYLQCVQIVKGERAKYRPVYQPYTYGTCRVQCGGQKGSTEDGACGSWAADAVRKYGALWADHEGVPPYSGQVAKKWGAQGPPQNFIDYADDYKVGNAAKITSYTQARDAIINGYPVTIASGQGFSMKLRVDKGKAWGVPQGEWQHQMVLIGADDDPARPGCYCLNSWGADAFGPPADDAPPGGFWVDAQTVDRICGEDCWSFSQFSSFPEQELDTMLLSFAANNSDSFYGFGDWAGAPAAGDTMLLSQSSQDEIDKLKGELQLLNQAMREGDARWSELYKEVAALRTQLGETKARRTSRRTSRRKV